MRTNLFLNGRKFDQPLPPGLKQLIDEMGIIRTVEKGAYVFQEGMQADHIFIIKSGLVQVSKLTVDGQELILRICREGDFIGELILFADHPKYLLSAKVLETCEVFSLSREDLEHELVSQNNNALTLEIMKWMSNHMRKFQLKIRDLLLNGKKGALYSTLIRLVNSYGIEHEEGILIDLSLTNQELAKFCNATREYVNRSLSVLRNLDVISIQKSGKILIKDLDYIKKENNCEDCPIEICNIN